ncbi:transcriptional regulator [Flavobacterium sp. L1I52]|uniref:Transcriptional regulator n=1 Tax=Flavobacterium pokkalii TaxID=1940408 RepID=A0ABR7URY9_9FLAO|nr:GntR family transcriptional regulator [Flavobacterium pokkalii]MBD0724760.1 transcriptional regulator [Flavobacterium pokkalii]
MNLLKDLKFSKDNGKALYLQIADSFIYNILRGNIKMDEKVPSINVFSKEYNVSRDTIEKAYNVLKEKKIIISRKGKGLYVNSTDLISKINVLFLINKLSPYKLKIYDAFTRNIGAKFHTDFEVYHCNESLFLSLMEKNKDRYDYYVIMPHFKIAHSEEKALKKKSIAAIKSIPRDKLIIMDNNDLEIDGNIIEIYQDFENDIYNALVLGLKKIKKYSTLNLVITKGETFPYLNKICYGFMRFCNEQLFDFKILNTIEEDIVINQGDLFIVVSDDDLVKLIDLINTCNLMLGKEVGVISYNETPFKRLLNLSVISTDFANMGKIAADMIINNEKGKIKNPFTLIERSSF